MVEYHGDRNIHMDYESRKRVMSKRHPEKIMDLLFVLNDRIGAKVQQKIQIMTYKLLLHDRDLVDMNMEEIAQMYEFMQCIYQQR